MVDFLPNANSLVRRVSSIFRLHPSSDQTQGHRVASLAPVTEPCVPVCLRIIDAPAQFRYHRRIIYQISVTRSSEVMISSGSHFCRQLSQDNRCGLYTHIPQMLRYPPEKPVCFSFHFPVLCTSHGTDI